MQAIAEAYTTQGWKVDLAVLDALASVQNQQDVAAVKSAVDPLYRKWVTEAAVRLQQAILPNPATSYGPHLPPTEAGTCILFSDALRYDVGQRLAGELECRSRVCEVAWGLAALPTVTPTAKPAISPVAGKLVEAMSPASPYGRASTGTALTADSLRKLVHDAGWQVLGADELGDPAGRAWTSWRD